MHRKFGKAGPWIYKGKQVDMYLLSHWMIGQNNKRGLKPGDKDRLHPIKNISESVMEDFVKDYPNGLREAQQ